MQDRDFRKNPLTVQEAARIIHQRRCFGDLKKADKKDNEVEINGKQTNN